MQRRFYIAHLLSFIDDNGKITQKQAERHQKSVDDLEAEYDSLEEEMLSEFYQFAEK
jgi:uncharacterized protein Yka (UPF0111/DUF47 family)